jgi:glycosyltransferase involved in cell wall biosynthesis
MNRRELLEQALPTWLDIGAGEIVIVDWNSSDKPEEVVRKHQNGTIHLVKISKVSHFHQAITKNVKVKATRRPYILSIDADIHIEHPEYFQDMILHKNVMYVGHTRILGKGTNGTMLFHRTAFQRANGFDERMDGWGEEDKDFIQRAEVPNVIVFPYLPRLLHHIDHDEGSRLSQLKITDREKGLEHNRKYVGTWTDENTMRAVKATWIRPNGKTYQKVI